MLNTNVKIERKELLEDVKNSIRIGNCIDITGDFDYDGMYIYDCRIDTARIHLGVEETNGNIQYFPLKEAPLFEDEIDELVGSLLKNLENDIKIKYNTEQVIVEYETYTFFDYQYDIKFVVMIDFSGQNRQMLRMKRKEIAKTQLSGKSKYLQ